MTLPLPVTTSLAIVVGFSTLILLAVYLKNKKLPPEKDIPGLLFAVLSSLGGIQVIYQSFIGAECQKLLGTEGTLALFLGGLFAVWLGIKEVKKLFKV
jgi:hypothetical protein